MWADVGLCVLFAVFTLTRAHGGEIFDVTTIYDVSDLCGSQRGVTGRVHSRTNALGLPLQAQYDKYLVTHDSLLPNINKWDTRNWTLDFIRVSNIVQDKDYALNGAVRLHFQNSYDGDDSFILFTTKKVINNQDDFFMIRFHETRTVKTTTRSPYGIYNRYNYRGIVYEEYDSTSTHQFYSKCRVSSSQSIYLEENEIKMPDSSRLKQVICDHHHGETPISADNTLTLMFENGRIKLYEGDITLSSQPSMNLEDYSQGLKYFSMVGFHTFSPSVMIPESYIAKDEGSRIVSPIITSDSSQLCLVLVLHSPTDTNNTVMNILGEDLFHTEHHLQSVNNVKEGWNIKHVNITLFGPMKVIIRKTNSMEIKINRISSCSTEGEEVELLERYTDDLTKLKASIPVYTVHLQPLKSVEKTSDETEQCLNGGVMTSVGCACRPGFSGPQCRQGCGSNRFGQDCGGLCSLRRQECEGLWLCTGLTDCQCAPGYTGCNCSIQCSDGSYGNDCSQMCGNCSSGICDIYTGKCARCKPGYVPPYCQLKYVYYALKPEVSSTEYGTIKVSFDLTNITGYGKPKVYQIQYREKGKEWNSYTSKIVSLKKNYTSSTEEYSPISNSIGGLKDGILYQVRLLLLVASFEKYEGDLVQLSETVTKCDIPEQYDYNVSTVRKTTSITFSWTYMNNSEHWCPVEMYEVSWKEGWQWLSEYSLGNFTLTGFLPGSTVKFRVRAKTTGGLAPYSNTVEASTLYNGSTTVEDLKLVSAQSSAVEISWQPPVGSGNRTLQYRVSYKCVMQPACSPGCLNTSEHQLTHSETNLTLSNLLPYAQYLVTVSPEDGLETSIYVATTEHAPTEIPIHSDQKPIRTNTSLTVFWDQGPVCSSFLRGYNYELVKASDSLKVLASGFTKNTTVSFHNLTARADYVIKVFVTTIPDWSSENYLSIEASTSATVPDAVCNLTVYKQGRNMLGLHWAEPKATYGKLKSFTVRHVSGQEEITHTIQPTTCIVWPELFCHTIEGLKSNRHYNISVSARNTEIDEDGEGVTTVGHTKESAPSAPEKLQLTNSSSTSVGLQWNYPSLANGVLRSFVINVEETEKFDQENCCEIYPLVEIPVNHEKQSYEAEVSGLQEASTYYVSVTAKTVGLGPSQSLVVYTRPPHLPITTLPSQDNLQDKFLSSVEDLSWILQEEQLQVNKSEVYIPLISAHLLFVVLNEPQPLQSVDTGVQNSQLLCLLQQTITKPFFFFAEYKQEDLVTESKWGQLPSPSPLITGLRYQLIAVQVTDYSGVYNTDLRYSRPFTYE